MAKRYWIVRALWVDVDMADQFILNGYYEIGNDANPVVLNQIEDITIGDIFILAITGNIIKSIGIVIARKSGLSFFVLWFPDFIESVLIGGTPPRIRPIVEIVMNQNRVSALINNIVELEKFIDNSIEIANMKKYTDLLESNKNIILTGAPGTGKTYLAKQMALKLIFGKDNEDLLSEIEKKQLKEQHAFVQFHPSYNYTDFVEGLRPIKKDGQNEIGFQLKNGIFKTFCCNAKKAWDVDIDKPFEEKRKFVFVIDEINRGEISMIFGELFFAIDPGYRGIKGSIQTQYHNINEKDDFVDIDANGNGCFYIPQNVYIIGTMNDIDRSVESFDFAMRRRFAWIEVKPEDRISMLDVLSNELKVEAIRRMKALNDKIKDNEDLGSHFQIGPAYFLKLKDYNGDFTKLWNYHLEILLKEYLRGFQDSEGELVKLNNAYYGAN